MDIRDLEIFLSVAKHLSYTRAGDEVNLSQPSVSIRVKQLENELGVKLFEQLGRKVALTEAGRLLIADARHVITAVEAELKAKRLIAVTVRGLNIPRELRIVYRKDKHLSRAAQTFISMARITSSKDTTS